MSFPPGKGKGRKCPTHKNTSTRKQWCDCCSKPDDSVCGLCQLPILAVNLSGDDEDTGEENPQMDTCRCFLSMFATRNASVEAMDCGSPRTIGFSIPPSTPSLHTPSTSRSTLATPSTSRSTLATPFTSRSTLATPFTSRSTLATPFTSRSTLATPSTSRSTFATPCASRSTFATPSTSRSTPHIHNLDVAKEAEKMCSPTEAKTKDSKGSKQSTPEMTSSSDGYALSSEDRFTVRSNKVTPKVRKEYNRGQARKLKTSPEKKACDVKSESSSEGFKLKKRNSNILTFGNSGGNKTSEQEKMKSSKESAGEGESDYTRRSSSQEEQNYNMGQLKGKFHTSPDSDNTYNNNNNERVIYINVNPSEGTSNLPNQANESDFISFKENFPFQQGYRPSFPRPFPQYQVPPVRIPVPMQRFPTFPERFRAPIQSVSGYQHPYGGLYYGPSLMPLPRGQKLDVEKVEHKQKFDRIKKWLQTVEPFPAPVGESKNEHLTPPTLEREEKGEVDPSKVEVETCNVTESDDEKMDYPKKARREKE